MRVYVSFNFRRKFNLNSTLVWQLVLQIVLIACNAVFACAEIAVISVKDARLDQLIADGNKAAVKLKKMTEQPERFLSTIQIAITLSGYFGSAAAATNFAGVIADGLIAIGLSVSRSALVAVGVVVVTIILSYITLIFGELVPKRLAMKNPEGVSLKLAGMLYAISQVFKPIVSLLSASVNGVLRLIGVDPHSDEDEYSEEEIRMMATAGSQKGSIGEDENEFIQNLFEFDDLTAEEFCTHRTQMAVLWADETTEDWEREIFSSRHSLYPVCEETTDHVVGVLDIKDYFALPERGAEQAMKSAVKQPYFVPDSIKADVLFKRMRSEGIRLAVVLDEYGGVTGIVTLNDLLEQLVGELDGESDEPGSGNELSGDGAQEDA